MLDIQLIRSNPEEVEKKLRTKGFRGDIRHIHKLDEEKRELLRHVEELRAKQNRASEEIGGEKNKTKREERTKEMKSVKGDLRTREENLKSISDELEKLLLALPNLPAADVPIGKDSSGNKVVREVGEKPQFDFPLQNYLAIAERLDIVDIERAAKVSGSRFGYLKRGAVLLEVALMHFTFETLTSGSVIRNIADSVKKGYAANVFIPIIPPVMIRPEVFTKMARLSDTDRDERYYLPQDNLYLTGSAEHTLGPLHMNETIEEGDLPLRYLGFSTCFRREAGSYGKDTKGILRVHQFDKIEMESFSLPEYSMLEQDFFVAIQEYLMRALKIPYRVVMISTGDMGAPDARQIDIEAWLPSENQYRETHTADLMTDYQSRRLNTKVRRKDGKTEFVHMNDATAIAMGRTLIAIIENYQQKDGTIRVPEALVKYTGFNNIS